MTMHFTESFLIIPLFIILLFVFTSNFEVVGFGFLRILINCVQITNFNVINLTIYAIYLELIFNDPIIKN